MDQGSGKIPNWQGAMTIKEEPGEENGNASGASASPLLVYPPQENIPNAPFSDLLKRIKMESDSTEISTTPPQQSLLLPYPSHNITSYTGFEDTNNRQGNDVYDMISQTAKDIVNSLQNSSSHQNHDTLVRMNRESAIRTDPIESSAMSCAPESTLSMAESTAPRTVQYTDPHSLNVPNVGTDVTRQSKSNNPFQIDQSQLTSVPVNQQSEELQNLGLRVYNQDELEMGIMAQVDQALAKEEEERLIKIVEKDLKAVKDDLRLVKEELVSIVKMERTLEHSSFRNREASQKLDAVKRHKENKIKQLKKLKARLKVLNKKLNLSGEAGSDDGEGPTEEGVAIEEALGLGPKSAETETERMIRQGEMTPFGTVMSFQNQGDKQPNAASVPSGPRLTTANQMTDFEKYLTDQQQKKNSKKRITKKAPVQHSKKNRDASEANKEPSKLSYKKTKMNKSKSAPSLSSMDQGSDMDGSRGSHESKAEKKKSNMFDMKDKRSYRPAERDFSNYRSSRPRYSRLRHNFSGDGRLSDHEDYDDDSYGFQGDADYVPDPDMLMNDEDDYLSGEREVRESKPRHVKRKARRKRATTPDFSGSEGESGSEGTPRKKSKKSESEYSEGLPSGRYKDDGDYDSFKRRVKAWRREKLLRKQEKAQKGEPDDSDDSEFEDVDVDDGFKVPARVWNKLYKYQKTCVKWMWELHMQQAGGIIGDEMGLGKTIQLIAFLVGLKVSKARDRGANTKYLGLGPTLIACPATVMHQWVKEFHKWWPAFRVAVLHGSGSFSSSPGQLIDDIVSCHGILVTSFSSLTINQDILLDYDWHYVVLDEGHKIRNPDAQVTIAAKRFRTCHRLILSGSPIQNNLKELWSLFDFIFPGKLGTLPDFMEHFAVPIQQGGYSTASQVQVQTAYKCSCVLRDTINPYLLRRMKSDVRHNLSLPDKNEQVLFCRLTDHQRDIYKEYIDSKECQQILKGEFMVFPGLITLRKVCNHPDLTTGGPQEFDTGRDYSNDERDFGHYNRSGKMIVIESLLKLWKKQGHRVLLFTQSKQMLDVLENFVNIQGYTYMRMDGGTSISARQPLITKFNENPSYFAFLLTTRVGGLGVNLTGANRVVIYDPDWNPSTDTQARERAWRIGQKKEVTVYRLITAGTIEEKIYHRQIFKQFLTNRVLKDPKQRRLFKANDLYELFTLNDVDPRGTTETSAIFAGTGSDVKISKGRLKQKPESERSSSRGPNRFDIMRAEKEKSKAASALASALDEEDEEEFGISSDPVSGAKETNIPSLIKKHKKPKEKTGTISSPGGEESSQLSDHVNTDNSTELELGSNEETNCSLSRTDTIDLTADGEGGEEPESSNGSTESVTEVSTEDSRTKRLKELAKRLSQKFSVGSAVKGGGSSGLKKSKSGSREHKKDQQKDKADVKREKDAESPGGSDCSDGKEASKTLHRKGRKEEKRKEEKDKSKRHKKSKKKRRKDAVFEGERIAHLAKFEAYEKGEIDPKKEKEDNAAQDEYVLAKLFKKTGVHSAMQHDKIMMSSNPDFALVEGEAERVAQDAARALKQSRSQCYSARSGIPTWTGQSGGQPNKPRFGMKKNSKLLPSATATKRSSAVKSEFDVKPDTKSPSKLKHFDGTIAGNVKTVSGNSASLMTSGELLTRMRTRNNLATSSADVSEDVPDMCTNAVVDLENVDLITDIRNYVAFMAHVDGQASTQELVDYFKSKIPAGNSAKFKAMLQQICDFHKRDGVGLWCLKPHFR